MNAHSRNPAAPAPRAWLAPNIPRIVASIGLIIKESERRSSPVTQYDIVKALFIADRSHLNKFGRPITFDNYVAMYHGPVPSVAYDLLKGDSLTLRRYDLSSLPWSSRSAEDIGKGCFVFSHATTPDEAETLAPSDVDALTNALSVILGLTFGQIRELTHGDVAYKEAWGDGELRNNLMSLGLLFDSPNFEAADEIGFVSRQVSEAASIDNDDLQSFISDLENR